MKQLSIYDEVIQERKRQDRKFENQTLTVAEQHCILNMEIGKANQDVIDIHINQVSPISKSINGFRKHLITSAAVAHKICETIDPGADFKPIFKKFINSNLIENMKPFNGDTGFFIGYAAWLFSASNNILESIMLLDENLILESCMNCVFYCTGTVEHLDIFYPYASNDVICYDQYPIVRSESQQNSGL